MAPRHELLCSALDIVAARCIKARSARRIDLRNIKRLLGEAIRGDLELLSFRFIPDDDPVIISYFDEHKFFERVDGSELHWQPTMKLSDRKPG